MPDASDIPKKPVVNLSANGNKLNELSDVGKVAGFHKNVDRPASVGSPDTSATLTVEYILFCYNKNFESSTHSMLNCFTE